MARVLLVDILAVLFGIGTWICVNALWVELPLMVQTLPEKWTLPSYLSVVIQLANLGPITYTLLNSFFPKTVTEKRAIYLSMSVETIATLLLAFLWKEEAHIFGEMRSVALLALAFFLALVDCSSRVLFLPFMTRFQAAYLIYYFIGEGLSSFIPSIFSLIQGVGGNPECRLGNGTDGIPQWQTVPGEPTFTVQTFFIITFVVMIFSMVAFHLLNYNSLVKKALAQNQVLIAPADLNLNRNGTDSPTPRRGNSQTNYQSVSPTASLRSLQATTEDRGNGDRNASNQNETNEIESVKNSVDRKNSNDDSGTDVEISGTDALFTQVSKPLFITLLIIQTIVCSLSNGVFPSIQSYSCLPYGNVAYHFAVTLSSMTNPIVCFMTMALPKPTQTSIMSVAVLSLGVSAYTFTTAIESPQPPLVGQISGEIILVLSWILLVGLFTYVRVSIATILRAEGRRGLFLCGAVTQIGSAIGALTTFFVVNFTETFQSYDACQGKPLPIVE